MAEEASKLRGLEARVAALETKFNFLLQFIRRLTEREEEKKKAMISKRQKEIYPALSLSKAAQTLPTPRRPAFHIPRPSRTEPRQFQPLPIPVPQLYTLLVKKKMITPVGQRTRIGPQPKDYNKDLTCEYHQGEVGHTVENCRVLRHRIQDLLDQGVLKFRIEGVINTIGVEKSDEVDITSTKIPWEPLFHELKKRGLLTVPRAPKESTEAGTCSIIPGPKTTTYKVAKSSRRKSPVLITRGLIRRRREQPEEYCMTIDQLRLSPYERTNFQARMERIKEDFEEFCEKKKEELGKLTPATPPEMSKPDPVVIQYATKEKVMLQTASVSTVQSSEKVPSVVIQVPQPFPYHDNKRVPWNYGMKVISTREGKPKMEEEVVGNLTSGLGGITRSGRCYTPGGVREKTEGNREDGGRSRKDEVLALLLASESHRKALLKVLNEAYVPEDITGPSFENMVTSILVTNQLTFSDDELPPEGRGHAKAFVYLWRPWLHTAGAVPFLPTPEDETHHRQPIGHYPRPKNLYPFTTTAKFPTLTDVRPEEASFHSFEFVTVIHRVAAVEPRLSRAGIMVAKEFVKAGFQPGQGLGCANQGRTAIVTLEGNKDRYGLGYTPTRKDRQIAYEARRQRAAAKLRGEKWPEKKMVIPHIRTTFPASAMFQVDEGDVDELALLFAEGFECQCHYHGRRFHSTSQSIPINTRKSTPTPDGSRGLETLEFEMFCEHEDPESHLQRYRKKMALYTNNEILMISMFHESLPECAVTWFYQLRNIACWEDLARAFLDRYRHNLKAPPPSNITTTTAEEEYAGPMVEGLSIHTIAKEEDSTTPPTRHCQQGEEAKMWTCVPLLQRVSSSNESLEIINLADEGEEPREVKIGTRCATEQKEALIALLREFHEIFAWSYQDMPGLDTDIVVHKIPLKPECKPVKQALRRMKPEVILKIKEEVEKQLKAGFPEAQTQEPPYQRAMVTLFHDMIHHEIEVYVDDMIAKSRTAQDHLTDLRKLFQRLKKYQLRLEPEQDVPSFLYLTVQEASMGCMLGQQDETEEEGARQSTILARSSLEPETRYLLVEKTCCALAWASKKLRQYMLYYTTWLVSRMDPIKYIFEKPALTGKIARWQVLLSEFDILFVARKAIKGQAIADYLADYPKRCRKRIGAVLVSPKGQQTPIAVKLGFDCTNNMTEYEACIVGLQAALEFGAYELEVFGDSLLIVSQTNGEWQARDPKLIPYQRYISRLVPKFKYITFTYTPRAHNHFADALATLASLIKLVEGDDVRPLTDRDSRHPGILRVQSIHHGRTENEKKYIRRMAFQFFLSGEILYKRTHDATLLRCVDAEEANRLIQEMHAGLMGAHANGPFLARKIMRAGYYWLTMEKGLHQTCPDVPQMPDASNGHEFILVAIDYFTKWVEACSFKNVTQVAVTRFVKNNIICRLRNARNAHHRQCFQPEQPHDGSAMPAVQDPAPQLCSIPPKMNGAVEAANKNVKKILSKMTETYKIGTSTCLIAKLPTKTTSVGATPLLSGIWDGSSTASRSGDPFFENPVTNSAGRSRMGPSTLYQRRIERAYNKKARPRTFQPGDLVLKKRNMALSDPRGKFAPSYEGPYVVKKAFSGGAIILADMDGEEFRSPINSDSVIKYHV
uniref:G-patch domain-containing protein n=1 Tax=Fagus sylvatica TaxID=28930 RepID=A0A2N9IU39_FAGSY